MFDRAEWIILLWTAVFGGAIGSFLNVVIYRLPNGLSLVTPPSHCPMCKTRIRWFDNVPVFGWIALGGRCRACRCWIPIRYPAVEAVTAVMFAAVAAVEMPAIGAVYAVHMLLLCTLLCAALIEYDGHPVPWRLFVPAIIAGVLAQALLLWPTLQSELGGGAVATMSFRVSYAVTIVVVIVALLFVLRQDRTLAPCLAAIAVCLGWRAFSLLVVLVLVQLLARFADRYLPKWLVRPYLALAVLSLAWILFAGQFVRLATAT